MSLFSNVKKAIYLGNPNLKKTGITQQLTEEQVREFVKCAKDPVYFIENYVKVVMLDRGFVQIDLYPFQKEAIKKAEEYFTEYIKLIIKDKWIDFEYLKQLRIEGVARGLNEEEIRDIIKEKKEDINRLKIM